MSYFVIAPDGQKYGPAELTLLNQWVAEGRISAESVLEDASSGARMPASAVPGLAVTRPQTMPPVQPQPTPTPTPTPSPFQSPTASSPFAMPGDPSSSGRPHDWSQAPGHMTASPYPRGGYALSPDVLPDELRGKWNWGAFFLSWIWGLNHKAYLTLLVFALGAVQYGLRLGTIGNLLNLGLLVWFALMGNEWAWKSGRFQTVEQFRQVQKAWAVWGVVIFALGFVVCGLGMAAILAGIN